MHYTKELAKAISKLGEVLVPSGDHGFRLGVIRKEKAVYNHKDSSWGEYAGDEYLNPGDEVVEAKIVR